MPLASLLEHVTFYFPPPSSQHPIHLPENLDILPESRVVKTNNTVLITPQTTIYCKFPNKHQYFDISALGRH